MITNMIILTWLTDKKFALDLYPVGTTVSRFGILPLYYHIISYDFKIFLSIHKTQYGFIGHTIIV